jgi:hypothetical protein
MPRIAAGIADFIDGFSRGDAPVPSPQPGTMTVLAIAIRARRLTSWRAVALTVHRVLKRLVLLGRTPAIVRVPAVALAVEDIPALVQSLLGCFGYPRVFRMPAVEALVYLVGSFKKFLISADTCAQVRARHLFIAWLGPTARLLHVFQPSIELRLSAFSCSMLLKSFLSGVGERYESLPLHSYDSRQPRRGLLLPGRILRPGPLSQVSHLAPPLEYGIIMLLDLGVVPADSLLQVVSPAQAGLVFIRGKRAPDALPIKVVDLVF